MTRAEVESLRQKLLVLGRRLKGDLTDVASEAFRTAGGEASGSLSNAPLHPGDLGTDAFEQEVAITLAENEDQMLEQIGTALERMDQGTYGRCQECGKEITPERLEAIPYTPHCIDCAGRLQGNP